MTPAQPEHITEWNVRKVASWLELSGFGAFVAAFQENGITGDVLVELDHHTLKDLGITSVGRRVMLLKAIQLLHDQYAGPAENEETTPRSASPVLSELSYYYPEQFSPSPQSPQSSSDEYKWIKRALVDRNTQIQKLTQEVERLSTQLQGVPESEQVTTLESPPVPPLKCSGTPRIVESDCPSSPVSRTTKAPPRVRLCTESQEGRTEPSLLSPSLSSNAFRPRFQSMPLPLSNASGCDDTANPASVVSTSAKTTERECKQSFRIKREDKCFEVLPAVLKSYQLDDDWRHYGLYIAYGTTQRHERFIGHEEMVYPIMRSLKAEKPVFVLKRMDTEDSEIIRRPHHARGSSTG